MKLRVYGCSDDLIEIEGDWREEFYLRSEDSTNLLFSDGTMLKVVYDGEWVLSVQKTGSATFSILDESPDCDYSNEVVLEGDFTWCAIVDEIKKIK